METQPPKIESESNNKSILRIVVAGLVMLFTIVSVSILYPGLNEFILLRFPGVNEFTASFFNSAETLAYIIVGLAIGVISDRIGYRRPFIIIGLFLSAVLFYLMTLTLSYPVLLVMRLVQGAGTVMAWSLLMTLAVDFAPEDKRGAALGIFGIFFATSMGLGPIIGGILTDINVFMPYYAATALTVIAGVVTVIGLRDPSKLTPGESLSDTFSVVKQEPLLVVPISINFIDRFHMGFFLYVLPLFIVNILGLSATVRGMVLGIFALPFILLQYPMGRLSDKIGRILPLIIGSIIMGVSMSLAGVLGSLGLGILISVFILMGIASGVTSPPNFALVGDLSPPEGRGAATALYNVIGTVGFTIGPIIGGWLILFYGYIVAFLVAGIIELLSLAIISPYLRRMSSQSPLTK